MCKSDTGIRMHVVNIYDEDLDCVYFNKGFCTKHGMRCNKRFMKVCKDLVTSNKAYVINQGNCRCNVKVNKRVSADKVEDRNGCSFDGNNSFTKNGETYQRGDIIRFDSDNYTIVRILGGSRMIDITLGVIKRTIACDYANFKKISKKGQTYVY